MVTTSYDGLAPLPTHCTKQEVNNVPDPNIVATDNHTLSIN